MVHIPRHSIRRKRQPKTTPKEAMAKNTNTHQKKTAPKEPSQLEDVDHIPTLVDLFLDHDNVLLFIIREIFSFCVLVLC